MILGWLYCVSSIVQAASISRTDWQVIEGRDPNRLVVKFHEQSGLLAMDVESLLLVHKAKLRVEPLFIQDRVWLEKRYRRLQSKNVEDLRTYAVITGEELSIDTISND